MVYPILTAKQIAHTVKQITRTAKWMFRSVNDKIVYVYTIFISRKGYFIILSLNTIRDSGPILNSRSTILRFGKKPNLSLKT